MAYLKDNGVLEAFEAVARILWENGDLRAKAVSTDPARGKPTRAEIKLEYNWERSSATRVWFYKARACRTVREDNGEEIMEKLAMSLLPAHLKETKELALA